MENGIFISVKIIKEIARENGIDPEKMGQNVENLPMHLTEPVDLAVFGFDDEKIKTIKEFAVLIDTLSSQAKKVYTDDDKFEMKIASLLDLINQSMGNLFGEVHKTLEYGEFFGGTLYKRRPQFSLKINDHLTADEVSFIQRKRKCPDCKTGGFVLVRQMGDAFLHKCKNPECGAEFILGICDSHGYFKDPISFATRAKDKILIN